MPSVAAESISQILLLDGQYQEGLLRSYAINRDEAERRLALKTLALHDTNAALEDLVSERELECQVLSRAIEILKCELSECNGRAYDQDTQLQKLRNEVRSLKTAKEQLDSSTELANRTNEEKAALTRELSSLRLELERLKSQLTAHQIVIAANGDLRLQLNSPKTELSTEKRSKTRVKEADEIGISELRSKLRQCESELKKETKENQGLKKELEEVRHLHDQLKGRLNATISKHKETQKALKEAQAVSLQAQQQLGSAIKHSVSFSKTEPTKFAKSKRARIALEAPNSTVPAVSISLDDNDRENLGDQNEANVRQARRRGTEKALLGGKSDFSITPFLNKSRDASRDFHELDSDRSVSNAALDSSPIQPRVKEAPVAPLSPVGKRKRQATALLRSYKPVAKQAAEAESELKSIIDHSHPTRRSTIRSEVRQVTMADELHNDNDGDLFQPAHASHENGPTEEVGAGGEGTSQKAQDMDVGGKKKKRKLFERRVKATFDEEEMEGAEIFGNAQRLAPTRRAKSQLGGAANAFAGSTSTFSPLKRDTRGVNASFLG